MSERENEVRAVTGQQARDQRERLLREAAEGSLTAIVSTVWSKRLTEPLLAGSRLPGSRAEFEAGGWTKDELVDRRCRKEDGR